MSDVMVPPAPEPSFAAKDRAERAEASRSRRSGESPLDAAFLARIYRSMLWFGGVMTLLTAALWKSGAGIGSFAGGLVLAALLLRTQEVVVRAALRPPTETGGWDPRVLLLVFLPLKYIVVIGILVVAFMTHCLRPEPLAAGFFAGQLVVVAKVAGWLVSRNRVKSGTARV